MVFIVFFLFFKLFKIVYSDCLGFIARREEVANLKAKIWSANLDRLSKRGYLIVIRSFAKGLTFTGFVGNPFKSQRAKGLKVHQSTVEVFKKQIRKKAPPRKGWFFLDSPLG